MNAITKSNITSDSFKLDCMKFGYAWEELEEVLLYAIKISSCRGLKFHYALNKQELLSVCATTIFEQYNNLKQMKPADRIVLLKWYMKNKVLNAFEYHGVQKRRHTNIDIDTVVVVAKPQNNIFMKELFEIVIFQCSEITKNVFVAILKEDIDFFNNGRAVWKLLAKKLGISLYKLRHSLLELKTLYRDYVVEGY